MSKVRRRGGGGEEDELERVRNAGGGAYRYAGDREESV